MRQFGRTQVIPVQGDASSFIVDFNENKNIPFAKIILQKWVRRVNMEWDMTENIYEAGYVNKYKTMLHNDLCGVLNLNPRIGGEIEDVQTRLQINAYHFQQEWDWREQELQRREQEY